MLLHGRDQSNGNVQFIQKLFVRSTEEIPERRHLDCKVGFLTTI